MAIEEIKQHIREGNHFLLSGGAGSGKTYTLMQVLDFIFQEYDSKVKVACITFTKVAVKEIKNRSPYENLQVTTIHQFLWESIRDYRNDLKKSLVALIEKEKNQEGTGIKFSGNIQDIDFSKGVQYKDYLRIDRGIISHDEALKLVNYMFQTYPLLCKIMRDRYDFILIDEYQDTERQVIDIFLEYLWQGDSKKPIFGFFGDSMQSIYGNGVQNLNGYGEKIKKVIKPDNWRCSRKVIELINKIRDDEIIQEPRGDFKEGTITFLYSNSNDIDGVIKNNNVFDGWDFQDGENTKELYLTHNLISKKAGFDGLFQIYNKDRIIELVQKIKNHLKENPDNESDVIGKTLEEVLNMNYINRTRVFDSFIQDNPELWLFSKNLDFESLRKTYLNKELLLEGGGEKKEGRGDKRDSLIKHLSKIQKCIENYTNNKIYDFLEATEFQIHSISDKQDIKGIMMGLSQFGDKTIGEIIELAHEKGIVKKDDKFDQFVIESFYVYERVRGVKYTEFKKLYDFEIGHSPYSTQHGVKGAEFENVFVVLDNGLWNNYNFEYLFNDSGESSVIERTRKMFYVTCSRAKNNLVVFYHQPPIKVITKAKEWFGEENVRAM